METVSDEGDPMTADLTALLHFVLIKAIPALVGAYAGWWFCRRVKDWLCHKLGL